jgi:hydroxyacylglutathione hydrolase
MLVKMFTVGMSEANCFLVGDSESREALIIDPGFDLKSEARAILEEVKRNELTVKYVVNTHGHPDHTAGNKILKEFTKAPILIHELDTVMLSDPPADHKLHDGDLIEVGSVKLRIIHTPGHTPGSIILLGSDIVFSGDTLFAGSVGRYDLAGGSVEQLKNSLKNKLLTLPDYFKLYPGHGPTSTIGEERRTNPFLQHLEWFS